jgi:hypothetical protein
LKQLGGDVRFEEMVTGHIEVLVGVASTPLGPVISVGSGGIHAEAMQDVTVRLIPIERHEAEAMIAETAVGRLLNDTRGKPAGDVASLVELIATVSQLVDGWPAGFELDLNPIAVFPTGVRVLDAAYVEPRNA